MFKVAICDDEKAFRDLAKTFLEEYGKEKSIQYEVDEFAVSSDLLDTMECGEVYDIYLLDIYMSGLTGMSIATEIRNRNIKSAIIFLTSSVDHALEAFGVDATHYVLKPYTRDSFFYAMDKAMREVATYAKRSVVLKVDNEYRNFSTSDILLCKAENKYQRIYLANGENLLIRITGGELYQMLEESNCFCRCGRTYMINLTWISKIVGDTVFLKTGLQIPLSHNAVTALRTAFFDYFN